MKKKLVFLVDSSEKFATVKITKAMLARRDQNMEI